MSASPVERARIERLWITDTLLRELVRPPRDGTAFLTLAYAPGALLIEETMRYPFGPLGRDTGFVTFYYKADTIKTRWQIHDSFPWLVWKITLPYYRDKVIDQDSLVWRWP